MIPIDKRFLVQAASQFHRTVGRTLYGAPESLSVASVVQKKIEATRLMKWHTTNYGGNREETIR